MQNIVHSFSWKQLSTTQELMTRFPLEALYSEIAKDDMSSMRKVTG